MRRLRDEDGIALITALLVLTVVLALGIGLAAFAEGQQQGSGQERSRESSFNLAEAALNAQVFQLGRAWPTSGAPATSPCTPTTSGETCPDANGLANGYSGGDYASPGCSQPLWKTVVQDDNAAYGGTQYYDPANLASSPAYDLNVNGDVWVRATAYAACHKVSIVALATRQLLPISIPLTAITANWFATSNNGNKVIANTQGNASQRGDIFVRCAGLTQAQCKAYRSGQVQPDTVATSSGSAQALTASQLDALRQEAKIAGTYWPNANGTCPPSGASLSSPTSGVLPGAPVFVEGPCSLSGPGNSSSNPGVLVVMNGTYSLGGNSAFYGLLYMANQQGAAYPNPVVSLGGCAKIYGAMVIDGSGGVNVGSCKSNFVFDPSAFALVRTYGGAVIAKNSFRVLSASTP